METLPAVASVLVASAFLLLGIRNGFWSLALEQQRFRRIVSRGFRRFIVLDGIQIALLGALVAYAAGGVPYSVAWQTVGVAFLILGCIGVGVGTLGSVETPTLNQMPGDGVLRKRVTKRRWSSPFLIACGAVWIWNGVAQLARV